MFSPVLRERGQDRLVYSTSVWFRIASLATAIAIVLGVASVPEGSFFSRLNVLSLVMVGICLFAALYLERWTFDRKTNVLERNVGVLFVYSRKTTPLDSLQRVVLHSLGANDAVGAGSRFPGWTLRGAAVLSIVDRQARVHRLDMVRGGSVREARRRAEALSAFCSIPLEDDRGERSVP